MQCFKLQPCCNKSSVICSFNYNIRLCIDYLVLPFWDAVIKANCFTLMFNGVKPNDYCYFGTMVLVIMQLKPLVIVIPLFCIFLNNVFNGNYYGRIILFYILYLCVNWNNIRITILFSLNLTWTFETVYSTEHLWTIWKIILHS